MKLHAATLCSGIGAPEHALADRYDFKFCAEIEKFPSTVLAHHYPETPNLGDITKIDGTLWRDKIDIIIGGPPCQSFSVAGDRQSLDDPRGMLTFQYLELLKQIQPAIAIYENVYGILTSKDNPWGKFLGRVVSSDEIMPPGGKWRRAGMVARKHVSVSWRTLNARNFGSPKIGSESTQLSSILEKLDDWLARHPGSTADDFCLYLERYHLSLTAVSGLLRRSKARGKKLHPTLRHALNFLQNTLTPLGKDMATVETELME